MAAFRKPPALKEGDVVSVIAPAAPFNRQDFEDGLKILANRYRPTYDDGIFSNDGYLAGSDARRMEELAAALADSDSRAVFCARGGYGVLRLLRHLSLDGMTPKAVVGFSDMTALHAALQSAGWVSIHAPVITQLGRLPVSEAERLFQVLESPEPARPVTGATPLVPGEVEGPLLGGNLSVVTRLLGTPYLPPLEGAILLLEDVGERPYRLDRMWTHLALAGVFEKVAGIALGEFVGCEEKDAKYRASDVLLALAHETGLPCAAGFPIGHGERNHAVGLGCQVRLNADEGRLEFLEGAVRSG